eukprot:TRINITY_DN37801_c0_g1_i1.p1 TRINITY_DN37801_c0_g1~~TRINITY_DN37801_c0_g1_i1.p1  ORF type:complete len:975 (+),score=205.83 TRINITY_DN37801_c0_g1_i1:169-3093(+)
MWAPIAPSPFISPLAYGAVPPVLYQQQQQPPPPAAKLTPKAPNAWARPAAGSAEASRSERHLEFLHEKSSASPDAWATIVADEDWRCFSYHWPKAFSEEESQRYLERLIKTAPWMELKNPKGTAVTRCSCWYASNGCQCQYTYGNGLRMGNCNTRPPPDQVGSPQNGHHKDEAADCEEADIADAEGDEAVEGEDSGDGDVTPAAGEEVTPESTSPEFLELMDEIYEHLFGKLFPRLPREAWPNCVNLNLYRDGRQGVGWHADDEALFRGRDRDCPILSLSLGATREFWVARRRGDDGAADAATATVVELDLKAGDIMTMEGRMQKHCLHLVPRVNPRDPLREERVNLTFRWIREHRHHCPLRHQKGRPRVPLSLRGIFGEVGIGKVKSKGFDRTVSPLLTPSPYVRCWSHELPAGMLSNPGKMEWKLCDSCKHKCYEEGRLCCEGRGESAGKWFCRKCWMKYASDPQGFKADTANASGTTDTNGLWTPSGTTDASGLWTPSGSSSGVGQVDKSGLWTPGAASQTPGRREDSGAMASGGCAAGAMGQAAATPWAWGANGAAAIPNPSMQAGLFSTPMPLPGHGVFPAAAAALAVQQQQMQLAAAYTAMMQQQQAAMLQTPSRKAADGGLSADAKEFTPGAPVPATAPLSLAAALPAQQQSGLAMRTLSSSSSANQKPKNGRVGGNAAGKFLLSQLKPPSNAFDGQAAGRAILGQLGFAAGQGQPAAAHTNGSSGTATSAGSEAFSRAALVANANAATLPSLPSRWRLLLRENSADSGAWSDAQKCLREDIEGSEAVESLLREVAVPGDRRDADYSFFRDGITPAREDRAVGNGGRWIVAIAAIGQGDGAAGKMKGVIADKFPTLLASTWQHMLSCLAAGKSAAAATDAGDPLAVVCGFVLGVRSSPTEDSEGGKPTSAKLALWLTDTSDRNRSRLAGEVLKEALDAAMQSAGEAVPNSWRLSFEDFRSQRVTMRL